jgi:pectate lyase
MINDTPIGFAQVDHSAMLTTLDVSTVADLAIALAETDPVRIVIHGTLTGTDVLPVASNKVIEGDAAVLDGIQLKLDQADNVTLHNVTLLNAADNAILLSGATNVWINRCTLSDSADLLIDITKGSDNVTISYCKFSSSGTGSAGHYAILIGNEENSTLDVDKLHVTIHHCVFTGKLMERMPSVRYGKVHIFNNYYNVDPTGCANCIRCRLFAELLIESNYFHNSVNPYEKFVYNDNVIWGKARAVNNAFAKVRWTHSTKTTSGWRVRPNELDDVFTPSYNYEPDDHGTLPGLLTTAGAQ